MLERGERIARFRQAMTDTVSNATVSTPSAPGAAKRTFIICALAGLSLLAVTAGLSVLWTWENTPGAAVEAPAR
jgi:hypothetical protein